MDEAAKDEAATQDQDLRRQVAALQREHRALQEQFQELARNAEEQRMEQREIILEMRQRELELQRKIRRLQRQMRAGWTVSSVVVSVTGVSLAAGGFLVMRELKDLRADELSKEAVKEAVRAAVTEVIKGVVGAGSALLLAVRPHVQRAVAAAVEKMKSVHTPMLQSRVNAAW